MNAKNSGNLIIILNIYLEGSNITRQYLNFKFQNKTKNSHKICLSRKMLTLSNNGTFL